jgi:hypothetical protein
MLFTRSKGFIDYFECSAFLLTQPVSRVRFDLSIADHPLHPNENPECCVSVVRIFGTDGCMNLVKAH